MVNNAGICYHRPALGSTDSEWDDVFDLNLKALWQVCAGRPGDFQTSGGGTIVNIGFISGHHQVNRPQWQPA